MMRRLREENGFTLAELLVGVMLMGIVMSATLVVLDRTTIMAKRADDKVDVQDAARTASREIARTLRNLATSPSRPGVVERATAYDLVFRIVDAPTQSMGANTRNLRRVRYCLDARNPDRARVLEQTQRWSTTNPPPVPSSTACPGAGWQGSPKLVADRVTNRSGGTDRPLWIYDQPVISQIAAVKLNLFMNNDPAQRSNEVGLQTGVFLRNQNRAPSAAFTVTEVGIDHILLNGSSSSDPEGRPLEFHWYVNGVRVGQGLVYDHVVPGPGTYSVSVRVWDSGGLVVDATPQTVVVE